MVDETGCTFIVALSYSGVKADYQSGPESSSALLWWK